MAWNSWTMLLLLAASVSVRLFSANIMKIPPNAFKHYQQHNHNKISSVGCFAWWPNQVKFCGNFQINIYNSYCISGVLLRISARRDALPFSLALTFQETNLPNHLRTRSKNESFAKRLSLSIETRLPVSKEHQLRASSSKLLCGLLFLWVVRFVAGFTIR